MGVGKCCYLVEFLNRGLTVVCRLLSPTRNPTNLGLVLLYLNYWDLKYSPWCNWICHTCGRPTVAALQCTNTVALQTAGVVDFYTMEG